MSDKSFNKTMVGLFTALGIGSVMVKEYLKKEPIQEVYSLSISQRIYDHLFSKGFHSLMFGQELVRQGKLWSLAKTFSNNTELHIRAIKLNNEQFYLSAHMDFGPRKSIKHLKGIFANENESYHNGHIILNHFLSDLK